MCSILGLFAAALVQSAPRIPGDPHSHGLAADAASRNTRAAGARAGDAASERILSLLRARRAPRDAWGAEDDADFDATYDPESAPEAATVSPGRDPPGSKLTERLRSAFVQTTKPGGLAWSTDGKGRRRRRHCWPKYLMDPKDIKHDTVCAEELPIDQAVKWEGKVWNDGSLIKKTDPLVVKNFFQLEKYLPKDAKKARGEMKDAYLEHVNKPLTDRKTEQAEIDLDLVRQGERGIEQMNSQANSLQQIMTGLDYLSAAGKQNFQGVVNQLDKLRFFSKDTWNSEMQNMKKMAEDLKVQGEEELVKTNEAVGKRVQADLTKASDAFGRVEERMVGVVDGFDEEDKGFHQEYKAIAKEEAPLKRIMKMLYKKVNHAERLEEKGVQEKTRAMEGQIRTSSRAHEADLATSVRDMKADISEVKGTDLLAKAKAAGTTVARQTVREAQRFKKVAKKAAKVLAKLAARDLRATSRAMTSIDKAALRAQNSVELENLPEKADTAKAALKELGADSATKIQDALTAEGDRFLDLDSDFAEVKKQFMDSLKKQEGAGTQSETRLHDRGTKLLNAKETDVVQDILDKMDEAALYAYPALRQSIAAGGATAAAAMKVAYERIRAEVAAGRTFDGKSLPPFLLADHSALYDTSLSASVRAAEAATGAVEAKKQQAEQALANFKTASSAALKEVQTKLDQELQNAGAGVVTADGGADSSERTILSEMNRTVEKALRLVAQKRNTAISAIPDMASKLQGYMNENWTVVGRGGTAASKVITDDVQSLKAISPSYNSSLPSSSDLDRVRRLARELDTNGSAEAKTLAQALVNYSDVEAKNTSAQFETLLNELAETGNGIVADAAIAIKNATGNWTTFIEGAKQQLTEVMYNHSELERDEAAVESFLRTSIAEQQRRLAALQASSERDANGRDTEIHAGFGRIKGQAMAQFGKKIDLAEQQIDNMGQAFLDEYALNASVKGRQLMADLANAYAKFEAEEQKIYVEQLNVSRANGNASAAASALGAADAALDSRGFADGRMLLTAMSHASKEYNEANSIIQARADRAENEVKGEYQDLDSSVEADLDSTTRGAESAASGAVESAKQARLGGVGRALRLIAGMEELAEGAYDAGSGLSGGGTDALDAELRAVRRASQAWQNELDEEKFATMRAARAGMGNLGGQVKLVNLLNQEFEKAKKSVNQTLMDAQEGQRTDIVDATVASMGSSLRAQRARERLKDQLNATQSSADEVLSEFSARNSSLQAEEADAEAQGNSSIYAMNEQLSEARAKLLNQSNGDVQAGLNALVPGFTSTVAGIGTVSQATADAEQATMNANSTQTAVEKSLEDQINEDYQAALDAAGEVKGKVKMLEFQSMDIGRWLDEFSDADSRFKTAMLREFRSKNIQFGQGVAAVASAAAADAARFRAGESQLGGAFAAGVAAAQGAGAGALDALGRRASADMLAAYGAGGGNATGGASEGQPAGAASLHAGFAALKSKAGAVETALRMATGEEVGGQDALAAIALGTGPVGEAAQAVHALNGQLAGAASPASLADRGRSQSFLSGGPPRLPRPSFSGRTLPLSLSETVARTSSAERQAAAEEQAAWQADLALADSDARAFRFQAAGAASTGESVSRALFGSGRAGASRG